MTWTPFPGTRVRMICSGISGTVDDVYRDRQHGHWMIVVTLDNGVSVTSWMMDFANRFAPVPTAQILDLAAYRKRRATVSSTGDMPPCA